MHFLIALFLVFAAVPTVAVTQAAAQATCRQKYMDDENACLKRTSNKGQCGDRARSCSGKCK